MARKSKKKGNTVSVNFDDVEAGAVLYPEGPYTLKTTDAVHKDTDGGGRVNVKCEILEGPSKKIVGKSVTVSFGLGDTQLWVLRGFLDAVGIEIPEGPMDLDLDEIGGGLEFTAVNTHNEYKDRVNNQFNNFGAADGSASSEEEDEDEAEIDEDEDEDETSKKKSKKDRREARKAKKSKVEDEEDEEDESEDEDEDEEEEAPKKSKKGKADKKSKKSKDEDEDEESDTLTEDEVNEMSTKELKGVIKAHKLDVDLDDFPSVRKQRLQVILALEEEGLIG